MQKSLQTLIDHYTNLGLKGVQLLSALKSDKEYQARLKARMSKAAGAFKVKAADRKRYVLSTDEDFEILGKIYALEQRKLSKEDKTMIRFLRTQLEHDWRAPIIKVLDELLKKYQ